MKTAAVLGGLFVAWAVALSFGLASALGGGSSSVGGFADTSALGLDDEQVRNVTLSLNVADELHAPPLAVLAMVVAGFGESEFRVVPNARGSGYCGVFQAHPSNIACDDTEQQARSFLQGGLGFQAGGAVHLATTQSGLSPGTISYMVEGSRSNFSSDAEAARHYDVHRERAESIITAWREGTSLVSADGSALERLVAEADRMESLELPYLWGGGHQAFDPDGPWDCSGAVSWLMHYLDLIEAEGPITSTGFMSEGRSGRGREFTIYANPVHVFIVVESGPHAGESWGTTNNPLSLDLADPAGGPAWHHHTTTGFVARHYAGH